LAEARRQSSADRAARVRCRPREEAGEAVGGTLGHRRESLEGGNELWERVVGDRLDPVVEALDLALRRVHGSGQRFADLLLAHRAAVLAEQRLDGLRPAPLPGPLAFGVGL